MKTEKTIYEKSFVSKTQAEKAATKELGEGWAKKNATQQMPEGKRWVVVLTRARAKAVKQPKPINPDKLTRKQFASLAKCPCCGSEDIYYGQNIEGEDRAVGCHACGWEFSFSAPKRMTEALSSARKGYVKVLSYAGTMSADNADPVAEALRGLNPEQVCAVADMAKGAKGGTYEARYASLNVGQRRMNAGNVIRAAFKNGEITAEWLKDAVDAVAAPVASDTEAA